MNIDLKSIDGLNHHESRYLYNEIFVKQAYLRHGLSLPTDAIVFDVGANIGMFSLFVGSRCPTAFIYAFEPIPSIYEKLRRNLSPVSDRVRLFCCGLSDAAGEEEFTFYPGYSMMSAKAAYADTAGDKRLVKLQAIKEQEQQSAPASEISEQALDDLLDYRFQPVSCRCHLRCLSEIIDEFNIPRIDFLKIDVQRAELDVLNGIREEHWPLVQQIAMEVHDGVDGFTKGQAQRISSMLAERGFRVWAEQYEGLSGTDRHNLFAIKSAGSDLSRVGLNGH